MLRLGATRRFVHELVIADRERRTGFDSVDRWPDRIDAFEDLLWLFSSTVLAHGIAAMRLDEAHYLYRIVRDLRPRTIVEIGRLRGGGTLLLAAAADSEATVYSYDLLTRYRRMDGPALDRRLEAALERYGLADRVRLIVGDSRTAPTPPDLCDLVFVDGDHSYEGVLADYRRWRDHLRPGGHLLFHDAASAPDLVPTTAPGPSAVVRAIESSERDLFSREAGAGSIAHFVKAGGPA